MRRQEAALVFGAMPRLSLLSGAVAAFLLLLSRAVERFTHRDEHQFVVPGLMTFAEGLLPYRDYPLFHMPHLVLLHGALGTATGWPLLSARVLAAVAAWSMLMLLGLAAWRALAGKWRLPLTLALPALLLFQPVFATTLNYVWNHSVPVFFMMLGFAFLFRAGDRENARWLVAGAGACIGLSACMRLTFLPLLVPFACAFLFFPKSSVRTRAVLVACFAAGACLAALPAIGLLAVAPEQFIFGNTGYPQLSVAWRRYPIWRDDLANFVDPVQGFLDPLNEGLRGRSIDRKFRSFSAVILKENWPIFIAFAACAAAGVYAAIKSKSFPLRIRFIALALPFLVWGCFAPSRFHVQYFFALSPVLILACVECLRFLSAFPRLERGVNIGLLLLAIASVGLGLHEYKFIRHLHRFERWGAVIAHRTAVRIQASMPPGRMLTLAPLVVAEAGIATYPEFSSGEFAWRTAHLLPREKRQRLKMISLFELSDLLAAHPPASVLVESGGGKLFTPIFHWVRANGYEPIQSEGRYEIWQQTAHDAP